MSRTPVASLDRLAIERGVAAFVEGAAVAVFRLGTDDVVAVDHVDPTSGAPVIARGLVGSVGDRVVVVSPLHKQRFDLRTGECLEDASVGPLRTYPVSIVDDTVWIGSE